MLASHCTLAKVINGQATLDWLADVCGRRTISIGVEHVGQTDTIGDLNRYCGISDENIVAQVSGLTAGRRR